LLSKALKNKRQNGNFFAILYSANSSGETRVVTAAKLSNFPNQVSRNRFRRLIREANRLYFVRELKPGYDIIVVANKQSKNSSGLKEIAAEAKKLYTKAGLLV